MGVNCDIFLFDPRGFLSRLGKAGSAKCGVLQIEGALLRSVAMEAFDRSSKVQGLADLYGGWYRDPLLLEEIVECDGRAPTLDVWLSLVLYDSFLEQTATTFIGSSETVENMRAMLESAGLRPFTINAFLYGHRLATILPLESPDADCPPLQGCCDLRNILHFFAPPSTSSTVGWLSPNDLAVYLSVLDGCSLDRELFSSLQETAHEALAKKACVCIIHSG